MKWISDLIDLIFPRHCHVCGEILSRQEQDICLDCLYKLPKIEKIRLLGKVRHRIGNIVHILPKRIAIQPSAPQDEI